MGVPQFPSLKFEGVAETSAGSCDRSFTFTLENPKDLKDCPVMGPTS
jgi:hypothetical protein